MPLPDPVILVPGITASYLRDLYPLPPETIWAVLRKDFGRASLHPDDLRYEAREPAHVVADQVYEVAYRDFVEELRHALSPGPDRPVPVYPFGYDWRQPLEDTEDRLSAFVEEVVARTAITRHYHADGYARRGTVSLVGHSMGGLVVAGYALRHGGRGRIGRVATIGTPYQGSFEAVVKVATGTANLGTEPPSAREREAARLTPALYDLMPVREIGVRFDGVRAGSLYERRVWQPSVLDTIARYVARHAVDPRAAKRRAGELFDGLLARAQAHRAAIAGLRLDDVGLAPDRWLVIAGANANTRVRVTIARRERKPVFVFSEADIANRWEDAAGDAARWDTGDGTVPLRGAVPPGFLGPANVACVTPDDFDFTEWKDWALAKAAGFHGLLCGLNHTQRLVIRFLTGAGDRYGNTWARALPGHEDDWAPAIPGLARRD